MPVIPAEQRGEMLKARRCVDGVDTYHELEYVSACRDLNVHVFVIGEDWGSKPHNVDVEDYLNSRSKKIVQVPYDTRTSSTRIKQEVIAQCHRGRDVHRTLA